jgi:hypothetical protein
LGLGLGFRVRVRVRVSVSVSKIMLVLVSSIFCVLCLLSETTTLPLLDWTISIGINEAFV